MRQQPRKQICEWKSHTDIFTEKENYSDPCWSVEPRKVKWTIQIEIRPQLNIFKNSLPSLPHQWGGDALPSILTCSSLTDYNSLIILILDSPLPRHTRKQMQIILFKKSSGLVVCRSDLVHQMRRWGRRRKMTRRWIDDDLPSPITFHYHCNERV